jgi:hypothetical protein
MTTSIVFFEEAEAEVEHERILVCHASRVFVVALEPQSRRPGYWRRRLR